MEQDRVSEKEEGKILSKNNRRHMCKKTVWGVREKESEKKKE
jgi:hypothetical protein